MSLKNTTSTSRDILFTEKLSNFLIEDEYNKYETQTKFDLSSATPDPLSLNMLLDLFKPEQKTQIIDEILSCKLSYSEQFGLAKTREKILKTLYLRSSAFSFERSALSSSTPSPEPSAQSILLTTGASEAIFLSFSTLFSPGEKIIVQKPIYQSLFQVAKDRGIEIIDWDYSLDKDFSENLESFSDLMKANPDAKALVINNPNNPLGIGFDAGELRAISNILGERFLIADEVARGISLKPIPSAIEVHANSIVISDLSKSYSLPGLRLGWIVANDSSLLEKFSAQKNYLSLRSPILSELIAEKVMDVIDLIAAKNKIIIQKNLDYIFSIAKTENSKSFFACDFSQDLICGHTIFPKLLGNENYLDKLFAAEGIFVVKGKLFGDKYSKRIRVGLGKTNLREFINTNIAYCR